MMSVSCHGFNDVAHIVYDTWLTHWGRVTHICVSKLTIIGSDNGLLPDRRQAIIWTDAGLLLIGPLGTNFSEILIEILTFLFKKMRLKVSSAKRWPFCLSLNVLSSAVGNATERCGLVQNPGHSLDVFSPLIFHVNCLSQIYFQGSTGHFWQKCDWSLLERIYSWVIGGWGGLFINSLAPGKRILVIAGWGISC